MHSFFNLESENRLSESQAKLAVITNNWHSQKESTNKTHDGELINF